jgi:hypothetical protein
VKHVLLVLLCSFSALACVEVPLRYTVPLSFPIHVSNRHGAVVGLKLRITRFKTDEFLRLSAEQQRKAKPEQFVEVVAESTTDNGGEARFTLSTAGDFDVQPDYPGTDAFLVAIHVLDNAKPATVSVEWPTPILEARKLHGQLSEGLMSSAEFTPLKAKLSLRQLVSFDEVSATTSGDDGWFQFADVPSGLYFVRVEGTEGSTGSRPISRRGDIPIFVGQDAAHETLSIGVSFTDCGLAYDLEENAPRYKPEACFKDGQPVQCDASQH